MKYFKKAELLNLNDNKILDLIKTSWGFEPLEPIEVICELSKIETNDGRPHYRIYDVKSLKNWNDPTY
ncbi:MAG: hypothetical protein QG567_700, partial [Campylobacterota bacterium]|nr:hypothetical protein [Campylobacterota bacterium]